MKYFLPDAQDLVDPSFDFTRETRSPDRIRQRDDHYAHEVFATPPYDGLLLSKGIVEAVGGGAGRYAQSQRLRLLREGGRDFFRLHTPTTRRLQLMGDCGAFTYVKEPAPPFSIDDVIQFYEGCSFDYGISVDHIILDYRPDWDEKLFGKDGVPKEVRERQELTIELARDFHRAHERGGLRWKPLGVAQGWSPKSYAKSIRALKKIGYDYIAVGGLVPLKTPDLLEVMQAVAEARKGDRKLKLHLLGVTRIEHIGAFKSHGVASFDSTSPLRQAFKDDKDNYYTLDRTYTALRVPQVQGNAKLERRIRAGQVDQDKARAAEQKCLRLLAELDAGKRKTTTKAVLGALQDYEAIHSPERSRVEAYRETLEAAPWRACGCDVCTQLGHHVILFRGAERNRRRGFHNVWVFYQRVQRGLGRDLEAITRARRTAPRQEALRLHP